MKKVFLFFIGVVFMVAGAAGLFLPVVPGWALIFVGLSFISPELADRLKRRFLRKLFKHEIVRLHEWEKFSVATGFTTRHFPLFLKKTDDLLNGENQKKFASLLGGQSFALLNQVHGDRIAVLDDAPAFGRKGFFHFEGSDGAVTNVRGLTLLVLTADCLSIFFRAGDWIGLAHAGWRGTQRRIAAKVYRLIREKAACRDSDIFMILGPRIGPDHYEVGQEFEKIFNRHGSRSALRRKNGKLTLDLAKENRCQLLEAGALNKHISDLGICTVSENSDFYSFRRERTQAGRVVSFILKK
ncbi:MAG: peptidoglycan editing factor PgeF [Candidatus Omnitrophica bacterium]|nr:peptidoglycan editing factor PgeF [Candidatus Omnitrophota bacterium]